MNVINCFIIDWFNLDSTFTHISLSLSLSLINWLTLFLINNGMVIGSVDYGDRDVGIFFLLVSCSKLFVTCCLVNITFKLSLQTLNWIFWFYTDFLSLSLSLFFPPSPNKILWWQNLLNWIIIMIEEMNSHYN